MEVGDVRTVYMCPEVPDVVAEHQTSGPQYIRETCQHRRNDYILLVICEDHRARDHKADAHSPEHDYDSNRRPALVGPQIFPHPYYMFTPFPMKAVADEALTVFYYGYFVGNISVVHEM